MVILYTDEQLRDVKRFCSTDSNPRISSVLGVDRTFNLFSCFVTVTVFKNKTVKRTKTRQPPIMIGPIFLHGDGQFITYLHFFSHISGLLSSITSTEIRSDTGVLVGPMMKAHL